MTRFRNQPSPAVKLKGIGSCTLAVLSCCKAPLPGTSYRTHQGASQVCGSNAFHREEATNNTAKYEGLLGGLRIAVELGIKKPIIRIDSQLVVKQLNKDYQTPLIEAYVDEVRMLEEYFDGLETEHVRRAENSIAD